MRRKKRIYKSGRSDYNNFRKKRNKEARTMKKATVWILILTLALLMCACHAASLVAPVHVCLVVASEYFKVSLGRLIFRTLPLSLIFCALMVGYYTLLTLL